MADLLNAVKQLLHFKPPGRRFAPPLSVKLGKMGEAAGSTASPSEPYSA